MIKLIDCTLRDGGYINGFNFGNKAIKGIIADLSASGIEIIELGFLRDEQYNPDKSIYGNICDIKNMIADYSNIEFAVMLQLNQYNANKLENCSGIVKHIRCAFHSYEIKEGIRLCEKVIERGYSCHVNPINLLGYSHKELMEIINFVNKLKPDTFTIVDTLGTMSVEDLIKITALIETNLEKNIKIGLHLHEHLSLSFALAQEFIKLRNPERNISVDASLNGMGRVPGNLCIELIMQYLNKSYNKNYDLSYIYNAIDKYIYPIKQSKSWGYSLPYAIAALNSVHRTYIEFLLRKSNLSTNDIQNIIKEIPQEEKSVYNEKFIDKLYFQYIGKNCGT